jgi:hypothetical protein
MTAASNGYYNITKEVLETVAGQHFLKMNDTK